MRISVVIPAYNACATLSETLDSVAAQTRPPDEVIVIDDGSIDATANIASQHRLQPRLINTPHAGAAAAMNLGARSASGECLAFLDADDLWSAEKLRVQADYLAVHDRIDAVLGHVASFVCPSVPESAVSRFVMPPDPQPGWMSGTLLIRADVLHRAGPFAEDLSNGFAIDWFDRARAADVRFHMLKTLVLRRRLRPGSLSARSRSSDAAMLEMARRAIARRRPAR
jgi:glycosyltransferase involved in cell wall biosynthesis